MMITKIFRFAAARIRKILLQQIWLDDYIKKGMVVGKNCSIQGGVVFDYSHCWLIAIGDRVTIAPEAYILAHDASSKALIGYTKIARVVIEDDCFIGARAIIMPGVRVGKGSIVAAGSVVTQSVPPYTVVGGNPARVISTLDDYEKKVKALFEINPRFDSTYTIRGNIDYDQKETMLQSLNGNVGFVR
nr:acyltransferase [Paenibacillus sp. HB172176]